MDEKRPGNENPEAGGGGSGSGGERTNLDLPRPGKDLLEHVIDVLQCGDKKDFSGKPVDAKEVPIDFGTIRAKVQDGIYNNLNKFESDVLMILNNAMISTLPDTDYFKEVQAINDLAKRVFNKLKTDPNGLKSEFPSKRSKRGREPARRSNTKPGPNRKRQVGNPNDQPRRNPSRFSRFSTPSASTPLEQTRCMPMPGIPSPTRQESQHQSAPHGQQGGIDAVNQGAPQRQRQFDDAGPWGRLTHQEPYHASHPGVKPSESDPVGWAEWKEHKQALTMLGQTGYMSMPPQLGIPQHLLSAPASQEPQHLSAPHGQQGDIYAMDQGASQQQRQRDDAGPLVRLTHQEPHHTSDPHVRPSGSNPADQGVRQKHEQALTTLGQTEHMPMPAWYGTPSNLHDAPTLQEPQHLSAPHGQQGGIYAVKQGAPQQQRQFDDAGPQVRLTHQEPCHAPYPGVRPTESDPVGWAEWKEYEQGLTTLGQTGYMPMKPQLGIPQHLLGAPASQEPQHLSAPHGQQGGIFAVKQGAPQQQRQFDDAGPRGRLTHQEPCHAPDPGVRPSESDPVGWAEWKEYEQALTMLELTGYMPMKPQLGIPQHLLGAPASQEPQHLSAPHGQQGDIYAVDRSAPQQQRQRDDAGPLVRLTHQEPHHTSDPRVRPSGSNPVDQGVRQEHEQVLPPGRRHLNQRGAGQGPVGPGGGGGGSQRGQGQQQAGPNDPQKVAAQKLATEQQPQMPTHSFIHQQPQMPTHPFIQQQPQVPISSYMGQQPRAPTHSFMGSNHLIPRRPYNMGIVTGCHAPPVPCDPITTINATERLGAQGADKGKGILANYDIDILSGTLKNAQGFNHPVAGPPYPDPPARPAFKPNSSLLEFVSRQDNSPIPSMHPSRVIMSSRLNQISGSTNQGYRASSAQLRQVLGCNPPAPSAPQVNEDYAMGMDSAPSEFIRPSPFSQDIMRWLNLQQQPVLPASRVHPLARENTPSGQIACMPLPVRSGIPSELLGAPAHQERQHLSAPLGQQGDIYPADQRASPKQRQRDDAGSLGRLMHQEPHHAFDPHVRPSGSNPVGRGIWQEHKQELPPGRRHLNQRGAGQGPVGPGGGGGGPQGAQGQQQAGTNDPHLIHFISQHPDLALQLSAKPPPSL